MNYFVEIKKLELKYGSNPQTKDCLAESLALFGSFSQDVIQKLKAKATNLPQERANRQLVQLSHL